MCFLLLKFGINFALPQTPGTWFGGHGVRGEITNTELRTSPGEKANVVFAGTWRYTTRPSALGMSDPIQDP